MTSVPLSSVNMNLTVEAFIVSESAKLTFTATYAITDPLVDAKSEVLSAAKKLHDGEWYVTGVYRDESSSGIETVTYSLTLRVGENHVNGIRANIKAINRPGLKFELQNIDYTPTQKQFEEGNMGLRKKLYERANEELKMLNESSSDSEDKWFLGNINFAAQGSAVAKSNMMRASASFYESVGNGPNGPQGLAGDEGEDGGVTQKLSLTASVAFSRKIYNRL